MMNLRARRDFGEILGDSFEFFKKNISMYIKGFIIYIMPLAIIATLCVMQLFDLIVSGFTIADNAPDLGNTDIVKNVLFGGIAFLAYIGSMFMVYILNYAVYSNYNATNGNFVWEDVSDYIRKNTLKISGNFILIYILTFIVFGLLFIPMAISPGLGVMVIFFGSFVLLYFLLKLIIAPYIYVEEGVSIFDSFRRSFHLTRDNWWSICGLIIVSSLLISIISAIFRIPLYLVLGFTSFSALDGGDVSMFSKIMLAVSGAVGILANLFLAIYPAIIITLKYSDLIEQKEGSSLADKIDTFGDDEDRFFENEGEY